MGKSLHKRIEIISLIVAIGAAGGLASGLIIKNEAILTVSIILLIYSFVSALTSFAYKFQENIWCRRIAKFSLYLLPFLVAFFLIFVYNSSNDVLWIITNIILELTTLFALIHIFLYTDSGALGGTLFFMIFLIIGIYMKRNRILFGNYTLSFGSEGLSIGYIIFGIRCLFIVNKIKYLKYVSFYGSWIISIAFAGQMFKLNHWPVAGWLLTISFTAMIIGTIFILLTLHTSGFIDWQPLQRRILRRLIFPWALIFMLYILRFMLPDVERSIWTKDVKVAPFGFEMSDYSIENKNGIK